MEFDSGHDIGLVYETNPIITGGVNLALISVIREKKVVELEEPRLMLPGCEKLQIGQIVGLDDEGQILGGLDVFSLNKHCVEIGRFYSHYKTLENNIPKYSNQEEKTKYSIITLGLKRAYTLCNRLTSRAPDQTDEKSKTKVSVGQ